VPDDFSIWRVLFYHRDKPGILFLDQSSRPLLKLTSPVSSRGKTVTNGMISMPDSLSNTGVSRL
jgi:hypothetical protein